jgi:hypothetical protein
MGALHYMDKIKKRYPKKPSYISKDEVGTKYAAVQFIAGIWNQKMGTKVGTIATRLHRGIAERCIPQVRVIKDGWDPKKWPLVLDIELALAFLDNVHEIIEQEKSKEAPFPSTPINELVMSYNINDHDHRADKDVRRIARRRHVNDLYRQQQQIISKLDQMEKAVNMMMVAVEKLGKVLVRDFQLDVPGFGPVDEQEVVDMNGATPDTWDKLSGNEDQGITQGITLLEIDQFVLPGG